MKAGNSRKPHTATRRIGTLVTALAAVLALGACASMPEPPAQQLQAAELAISSAEQAGVADYAAAELKLAREKLVSARNAVEREQMDLAGSLAVESKVEADLALAKTEMLKARDVNADMQQSIDTLKLEMQRNSGARQ